MSTSWRGICEGPKTITIIAVLNEATLLAFDDYTKERGFDVMLANGTLTLSETHSQAQPGDEFSLL